MQTTHIVHVSFIVTHPLPFRVLMDVEEDYKVLCERVLFQPFHIQLALERNLCSAWYSKRPTLSLNCQMGEFKVRYLGYNLLIALVIEAVYN